MRFFKAKNLVKDQGGFTLSEIAVVFVLAAIMLIPLYAIIFHVTRLKPDEERFAIIQEALAEHLRVTGTLPCPAPPAMDMNDNTDIVPPPAGDQIADVYQAQVDAAGVCVAGNGVVSAAVAGGNQVLIGAVPVENLRAAVSCGPDDVLGFTGDVLGSLKDTVYSIREVFAGEKNVTVAATGEDVATNRVENSRCPLREYILDENGIKFTYAVVDVATQPGYDLFTALPAGEGIQINDQNGLISDNEIYILLSHGADRKGGYLRDGTLSGVACNAQPGLDQENCDHLPPAAADAIFVSAPRNNQLGAGSYNDTVDYGIAGFLTEESFWRWGGVSGGGRDMVLNDNARLVIDPQGTAPAPGPDDAVVVNRGGVSVTTNLEVCDGACDDGLDDAANVGGGVTVDNNLTVGGQTNARAIVRAPKFCYPVGKALTQDCDPALP